MSGGGESNSAFAQQREAASRALHTSGPREPATALHLTSTKNQEGKRHQQTREPKYADNQEGTKTPNHQESIKMPTPPPVTSAQTQGGRATLLDSALPRLSHPLYHPRNHNSPRSPDHPSWTRAEEVKRGERGTRAHRPAPWGSRLGRRWLAGRPARPDGANHGIRT